MVIDVSSAFLYADVLREIYIELPECDREGIAKGMVGMLLKALYGTRDAPLAWQEALTRFLVDLGFEASKLHPAIFHHPSRNVDIVIHVDDMFCCGDGEGLRWFRTSCQEKFEVTFKILEKIGDEINYLGRTIRKVYDGFEWEGDKKHIKILTEEWGMEGCKPVGTPLETSSAQPAGEREKMSPQNSTLYRRAVARINYMSQDHPNLSVAANILARSMANPLEGDEGGDQKSDSIFSRRPIM